MRPHIIVKFDDADLPCIESETTRVVAAANGFFREHDNRMFHSSTRVAPADLGMADHRQYCHLRCGKLPRVLQRAMLSFFQAAHALHGGEAALVLLYHPEKRLFLWHCPRQTISLHWIQGRWVASDIVAFSNPTVLPAGYLHFGDCHLHVGCSTAPSVTDVHDDQDGMHIIVADIQAVPRYHIDFVVDGKRFGVAPKLLFDDPQCLPGPHSPRRWLDQVQIERYFPYQWQEADPSGTRPQNSDLGHGPRGVPRSSGNGGFQA